jgi:predicted CoA-substrate-specific enzyme activase
VVAVAGDGELLGARLEPTKPRIEEQTAHLARALAVELGIDAPLPLVATGYGRHLVRDAVATVTEITCHARGVFRAQGGGGTLVDIGGQDSKAIRIGDDGRPIDFAMNDKCAAGTGRFLEHTAARLDVEVTDLGRRALSSAAEEHISSTCTVFAESEIISLIGRGADVDAIIRGLHRSLIGRIVAMARTVGLITPLILSGGVALNPAVPAMMEEATGMSVVVPPQPQLMGAYGAALTALEG